MRVALDTSPKSTRSSGVWAALGTFIRNMFRLVPSYIAVMLIMTVSDGGSPRATYADFLF